MTKRFVLFTAILMVAPHFALAQAPSADVKQLVGLIGPANVKAACAGGREAVHSAVRVQYGQIRSAKQNMPAGVIPEATKYIMQTQCSKK